jgi:hypothetical protein
MIEKNSVVKNVQANGTFDSKFGLLYKFEIEMENGDIGEYATKMQEQNKFVVGQKTDYQFIDGMYPKIKPISTFQNNSNYSGGKNAEVQEYIIKQSSLKCAVDLCIAQGIYSHEDILSRANAFTDWVLNRNQTDLPFADNKSPF